MSLGSKQEEAPETHASTHDTTSSSAILQLRGGVPSERDPLNRKYKAHGNDNLSI